MREVCGPDRSHLPNLDLVNYVDGHISRDHRLDSRAIRLCLQDLLVGRCFVPVWTHSESGAQPQECVFAGSSAPAAPKRCDHRGTKAFQNVLRSSLRQPKLGSRGSPVKSLRHTAEFSLCSGDRPRGGRTCGSPSRAILLNIGFWMMNAHQRALCR